MTSVKCVKYMSSATNISTLMHICIMYIVEVKKKSLHCNDCIHEDFVFEVGVPKRHHHDGKGG